MGPNRLGGAEMLLRGLLSAGLSEREAIDAGLVLTTYVVGFALEQQAAEQAPSGGHEADPDRYPTLARLSSAVPIAGWARFEEGLSLILDGVASRLASQRTRVRSGAWPRPGP